jgi:small subunit ribosomal protein S20
MPVTKSAKKRLEVNKKKRDYNIKYKNKIKTLLKECKQAIASNQFDKAKTTLSASIVILDKAASKGVIHKKTASRKKSRLARKVNQLQSIGVVSE